MELDYPWDRDRDWSGQSLRLAFKYSVLTISLTGNVGLGFTWGWSLVFCCLCFCWELHVLWLKAGLYLDLLRAGHWVSGTCVNTWGPASSVSRRSCSLSSSSSWIFFIQERKYSSNLHITFSSSVGDLWYFGADPDPDPGSVPLANGSGSGSFLQWLQGCKKKIFFSHIFFITYRQVL